MEVWIETKIHTGTHRETGGDREIYGWQEKWEERVRGRDRTRRSNGDRVWPGPGLEEDKDRTG